MISVGNEIVIKYVQFLYNVICVEVVVALYDLFVNTFFFYIILILNTLNKS